MAHTAPHNHRAGVIFDLDGTLADTLADITDALNEVFAAAGWAPVSRERVRGLVGQGLRDLLANAARTDNSATIERLVDRYRAAYTPRLLATTRLYPGVDQMLTAVCQVGMPVAVLSNKPHEFTEPICRSLLGGWPFVRWLGTSHGQRRKPDPATSLELAAEMNRRPADVIFVGDSPTDVLTGRHAGMKTAAVTWGYRDRPMLLAAGPDAIVNEPEELGAILLQWGGLG